MYKSDKRRAADGGSAYYTSPELDAAIERYFAACDEEGKKATMPGMLLYLGLSEKEWATMEAGEPGYTRHAPICKKALLKIRDRLEQRTDTAAIFLLKQKSYGGYTDRPEADSAGGIKINVTFGKTAPNKGK